MSLLRRGIALALVSGLATAGPGAEALMTGYAFASSARTLELGTREGFFASQALAQPMRISSQPPDDLRAAGFRLAEAKQAGYRAPASPLAGEVGLVMAGRVPGAPPLQKLAGLDRGQFDFPRAYSTMPGANLLDWLHEALRLVAKDTHIDPEGMITVFGSLGFGDAWSQIGDVDARLYFSQPIYLGKEYEMREALRLFLVEKLLELAPTFGLLARREALNPQNSIERMVLTPQDGSSAAILPVDVNAFNFEHLKAPTPIEGGWIDPLAAYYAPSGAAPALLASVDDFLDPEKGPGHLSSSLELEYRHDRNDLPRLINEASGVVYKRLAFWKARFEAAGIELPGPSRGELRSWARAKRSPAHGSARTLFEEAGVPYMEHALASTYREAFERLVSMRMHALRERLLAIQSSASPGRQVGGAVFRQISADLEFLEKWLRQIREELTRRTPGAEPSDGWLGDLRIEFTRLAQEFDQIANPDILQQAPDLLERWRRLRVRLHHLDTDIGGNQVKRQDARRLGEGT